MVDELLAGHGIAVSHQTARQWALKFGQGFANQIRPGLPAADDKWHIGEVVLTIAGVRHWSWCAVGQNGMVLDILVQSRRDKPAAKRLLRKYLKKQVWPPCVVVATSRPATPLRSERSCPASGAGSTTVSTIEPKVLASRPEDGNGR